MNSSYKEKKNENGKRTYDLNDYFKDRKRKIEAELVRARKRNMEARYPTWFNELNGLSEGKLRQFAIELENKKNAVKAHLELKKRKPNVQMPSSGLKLKNNQPYNHFVGSCLNLYQVQSFNHNPTSHDHGWFNDAPSTWSIPLNAEMGGFGYLVFEGDVVYDNSNSCACQLVEQCCPNLALQDSHDGVGGRLQFCDRMMI